MFEFFDLYAWIGDGAFRRLDCLELKFATVSRCSSVPVVRSDEQSDLTAGHMEHGSLVPGCRVQLHL